METGMVHPSFFARLILGDGTRTPQRVRLGQLLGVVWIVFIIFPIIDLIQRPISWPERVFLLFGIALFIGLWIRVAVMRTGIEKPFTPARWACVAALYLLAITLCVTAGGAAWFGLFYYFESTIGWLRPRIAMRFIALTAVTVLVLGIAFHEPPLDLSANVLLTILIGSLIISMFSMVRTNAELRAAREELARLAVAEERLRFSRDLHDLLGHSLSLITLKSELAGRLATVAPERAASEIRDIEQVARKALREVREAVAGYRQPTLAGELAGARTLLTAAGITCTVERVPDDLPTHVDALFAWAVREGVTNVIRHSHARRCTIAFDRDDETASLTLSDDGRGATATAEDNAPRRIGGSGLAGLAERVTAAGGAMDIGPQPGGGFRLHLTVPLHAREDTPPVATDAMEATA
jgi:two-component system sensor histidine kinase DesK